MPIPEFIQRLRSHIGTDLLLIPAVTAVVLGDDGRLLLVRRADTGTWAPTGGIMEPGEEVAESVVREVLEETSVRVLPERITGVYTHADVVHRNGDRSCYVVTAFRCRALEGEPRVNDDESLEVAWFAPDDLPSMDPIHVELVEDALHDDLAAAFRRPAG